MTIVITGPITEYLFLSTIMLTLYPMWRDIALGKDMGRDHGETGYQYISLAIVYVIFVPVAWLYAAYVLFREQIHPWLTTPK